MATTTCTEQRAVSAHWSEQEFVTQLFWFMSIMVFFSMMSEVCQYIELAIKENNFWALTMC